MALGGFGPAPRRLRCLIRLVLGFEATVTGSDFIDPYSSGVERHQFKVPIKLQAWIQVVDPDGQQTVLG